MAASVVVLLLATIGVAVGQSSLPHIPGADLIGRGFDGATLKYRGLPVLQLTYDDSTIWTNPIYTDQSYSVPLEVIVETDIESLLVDGSIAFSDVAEVMNDTVKSSHSGGFLGFGSSSSRTEKYLYNYYGQDSSLALSYQYHSWYQLVFPPLPPPTLHDTTLKAISRLPAQYDPNPDSRSWLQYRKFIQYYGTHYVDSAIMGGKMELTSWFDRCLVDTQTKDWVLKQSGWSFLFIVSYNQGQSNLKANTSVLFAEHSVSTIDIVGGKALLLDQKDWQDWIESVKTNPAPIYYTTSLIADLIDPSDPRKESMTTAVKDYLMESNKNMENLKASLIPPTPFTIPDWCKRPATTSY